MARIEFAISVPDVLLDILKCVRRNLAIDGPTNTIHELPNKLVTDATDTSATELPKLSQENNATSDGHTVMAEEIKIVEVDESVDVKEDDENDDEDGREDWKPIRAIADKAFKEVLLKTINAKGELSISDCEVIKRAEGSYHLAIIICVAGRDKYVIKVPAIGTASIWQEGDAFNLRSEVGTMTYLRSQADIPIPQVFGFDDSLENEIGAPYIVMEAAEGIPAHELWFEHRTENGHYSDWNCDFPSDELALKRRNFLKSLAGYVTSLNCFRFEKIGTLNFDEDPFDPEVSPSYFSHYDGSLNKVPAFHTSREYWAHLLEERFASAACKAEDEEEMALIRGSHTFFSIILNSGPFSDWKWIQDDDEETFPLMHNDIDLHNIFVDNDGNVTCIIDWDGVQTVPRYIGPMSLPVFLREDYEYDYSLEGATHMPWCLDYYRKLWTKYIAQSSRKWDAKTTYKSTLLCAVATGVTYGPSSAGAVELIKRVFKEVPMLRAFDWREFIETVGNEPGGRGETILREEIPKLFA